MEIKICSLQTRVENIKVASMTHVHTRTHTHARTYMRTHTRDVRSLNVDQVISFALMRAHARTRVI